MVKPPPLTSMTFGQSIVGQVKSNHGKPNKAFQSIGVRLGKLNEGKLTEKEMPVHSNLSAQVQSSNPSNSPSVKPLNFKRGKSIATEADKLVLNDCIKSDNKPTSVPADVLIIPETTV